MLVFTKDQANQTEFWVEPSRNSKVAYYLRFLAKFAKLRKPNITVFTTTFNRFMHRTNVYISHLF